MSDWNEVRRLQAELERVQSAASPFRLSEVNCVEIVKKLSEMKLISLLYTTDGKEYIVQEHLEKEIMNEIEANKGRIEVTELQQILNVDLNHINRGIDNIMRSNKSFERIPGEVITSSFKVSLCTEINEILLQNGFVSLSDLSSMFSLPLNFITKCIENSLNTIIIGQLDKSGSGLLYTESYVSRHRSRLRGLFSAMTRPTPVPSLVTDGKYHERLFHTILNELISSEELAGSIHGRGLRAIFIPTVYSQMQSQWVDRFLDDNGYLEYDALVRMGIESPQTYIKTRYKDKNNDLLMLKTCCIGPSVISEIEAHIEDTVITQSQWINIMSILPSPCTDEDGELFLQKLYSNDDRFLIASTILSHQDFVRNCLELFKTLIEEKAAKAAASSGSFLRQVSQEGKREGGEGGGAKKGGKHKKGKGRRDDGDESWELIFMPKEKIEETLMDKLDQIPQNFAETISNLLYRPLQERFESEARAMLARRAEGEAGSQRKRHSELQEGLQQLWNRLKLFEKGIEMFEGDMKVQLSKYLLHTICTDLTNQLLRYIAQDYKLTVPEDTGAFNKERAKLAGKLPDELKKLAQAVNSSLSDKEVGGFVTSFQALCETESCGVMLRKLDKKKEKQVTFNHIEELKSSLKEEQDPAMSLHLVTLVLFHSHTGCLLHTPGRLIPRVIAVLRGYMKPTDFTVLDAYQSLVVLDLKTSTLQSQADREEGDTMKDKEGIAKVEDGKLEIDSDLFDEEAQIQDVKVLSSTDGASNGESEGKEKKDATATDTVSIRKQLELKMDELKDLVLKKKSNN